MRRKQQHLAAVIVGLYLGVGTILQAGAQATAPKPEQLGQVNFPVSCTSEAQAKFHRAMALYDSFDWKRATAAFGEIASLDPRCGMAHWGLAMVAAENPFPWPVGLKLRVGLKLKEGA